MSPKLFLLIISSVLVVCGVIELFFTYQYYKKVKNNQVLTPTAPFAIWSGAFIGIVFIAYPLAQLFNNLKYVNRSLSIISGILFLIAAVWTWIRADKSRKKLKAEKKPLSSSWSTISAYMIVIITLISSLSSLF